MITKYLLSILFFTISVVISSFGLSNIILTIFYTIPRLKKENYNGNLVKKVPIRKIIAYPIIFSIVLALWIILSFKFLSTHLIAICIGFVFAFIGIIVKLFKKNPDIEDDFKRYYKDYLKSGIDYQKQSRE